MKKFTFALYFLLGALCAADSVAAAEADWVANLVSPTVVTNFNKYGEDVLEITGAATNGYKSVAEALEAARPGDTVSLVTNANETLRFAHEGVFAIDLNGFTLAPSVGETDVVCFDGVSSNSVVSIANGTLSGNLRLGLPGAVPASSGFVMLGSELVSDGDIFATGDLRVLLTDGFRSTYTNGVFSTEVPIEAQEGAIFGYRHNPKDVRKPGKLVFDSPDLQLVSRDGAFVVTIPQVLQKWSFDLSHWMDDVPDETSIYKICLPATHDSGMSPKHMKNVEGGGFRTVIMNWNMFKTQSLDIGQQLEAGSRVFDLRFRRTKDGDFRTYHGKDRDSVTTAMYGESLQSVLDSIDRFLTASSNEFVIVTLSHPANANGMDTTNTQAAVIGKIKAHAINGERNGKLFKWPNAVKGDPSTWPKLNAMTLGQVRGKLIVLVDPENDKNWDTAMDTIDPANGIWGFDSNNVKAGYYGIFDDYANRDSLEDMSSDQLGKWKSHSKRRIEEESKGNLTTAISLDWTMTFNPERYSILKNWRVWTTVGLVALSIAAMAFLGPLAVVVGASLFSLTVWTAVIDWRTESFGHDVEDMAAQANASLPWVLERCMREIDPQSQTNVYLKPSMVSIDYASPALNKKIVELNADLCRHAAEVCRIDGSDSRKYEKLNEAFKDPRLTAVDCGYVVRLLRSEEPDDANGFEVKADGHVKFDLNGKWLRRGDRLAADKPLLTNRGELEIVNTKTDIGGFEKIGMTSVAGVNGAALFNDAGGRLTVRGVAFPEGKSLLSAYALIHSVGGKVVLENVALTGECAGISQSDSELWLTNCTIATSGGPVYMGSGGRIEVCGGRFEHTYELLASGGIVLDRGSTFVLRGGEVRCDSPYEISVNDGACFEVRDGFVRTSSSSTDFEVRGDGAVKLYGGCYSAEPPVKYIVDGVCANVANYPAYPYEIVPSRNGRLAVAEIREIDNSLYGSVQAAVDEVEKRGGGLTVGLLANTHPSKSIVIPAETAVTLDLQGHGITMRGTEEPVIRNLGGLTVKDSSEEGTGYVSMFVTNGCRAAKSGGIVFNAGVFALAGGTLRTGFAERGGGLYNETNGYARIDGGVISDCRATDVGGGVCNRGLMDLRGGRIMSCTAGASGGGIRNEGDLRMTEGEVRSCSAEVGGGLSNGHDAVLVGGIIADNESANGVGAGVYADSYTQTTFCGAWVKDAIGVSSQRRSSTARLRIVEGLFGSSLNTAWVADGSLLVPNEDTFSQDEYPHRVLVQYVAQVGRERYATLEDAFRQTISTGDEVEVKLLTDVRNVAEELPDGAYAALDLSGHWLFGAQDALVVHNAARLRVFDSVGGGTVSCLFATNDATACAIRSTGFCAVEGGRYADRVLAADTKAVVRAGLFGQEPRTSLVDPASVGVANADAASRNFFPFAVMARNPARFKDMTGKALALQEALQSERVQGEALHTVEVGENQFDVALVVPTGTRAVLDLCGHVLQGVAHEPVITVEKGAVLTIVDSVGGGRIVKDSLAFYDPRLQGAIVNRGMLTLAGGTIANCIGVTFGGVYNAEGATFVMSGGSIRGCGSTEPMSTYHSAGGVLNAGTFWMTGGEIEDCEAVMGVASVFNEDQAVFRQLGGEIKNGNCVVAEGELACQVLNRGDYLLLDGRVSSDASSQLDESAPILNWMSAGSDTRFAQLWGEVSAAGSGCAVCNRDGRAAGRDAEDVVASRISNGKIAGRVVSMPLKAFGVITGGFFTDDETNVVASATIPEFVAWETNTDAATKDLYSSRITPQYEAEVESGGLVARVSLQQALNLNYSGSYTVKLVTDVKDCVVCSNMVPVTLDLNGYAITGTGKVFGDGFAHSVIRNEGILTVIDSSAKKTGLIAMPSVGEAEMGGAICNLGTLDLGNIAIWGCRARRGGGVYNAPDARARLTNVRMTGCYASGAEAGDLILNAGTLALEGCTLEAWTDATNASCVREGGALVNVETATLNGCRVRGRIMSLDGAPAVTIASGLFDHEPPTVYRANADAETRLVYRWEVVGEQEIVATLPGELAGVRGFKTLADAVATAGYGATVTIVGDVTDENVRLPSGLVVRIGETGAFRKPGPEDLLHDYYEVREILEQGRVVGYAISLDAAKVTPQVGDDKSSGTPWLEFVRDDRTGSVTSAVLTLINAYEGLYYGVETGPEPDDLKPTGCWIPSSNRGVLRLEVPAVGDRRFYRIRVTDHLERSILPRIGE